MKEVYLPGTAESDVAVWWWDLQQVGAQVLAQPRHTGAATQVTPRLPET